MAQRAGIRAYQEKNQQSPAFAPPQCPATQIFGFGAPFWCKEGRLYVAQESRAAPQGSPGPGPQETQSYASLGGPAQR
jgi:hypothetical protein